MLLHKIAFAFAFDFLFYSQVTSPSPAANDDPVVSSLHRAHLVRVTSRRVLAYGAREWDSFLLWHALWQHLTMADMKGTSGLTCPRFKRRTLGAGRRVPIFCAMARGELRLSATKLGLGTAAGGWRGRRPGRRPAATRPLPPPPHIAQPLVAAFLCVEFHTRYRVLLVTC